MARIELSEMLVGLRKELHEAQVKAEKENLKFKVDSIDVEMQVTVSKEAKGEGKVSWKFWVFGEVEGKAAAEVARENVQTIRLRMTPEQGGEPLRLTGEGEKPGR
jgi:hypothetical protein